MATYTTTAQIDGDQGNLSAGKLELQLAKAENALDKLEATARVTAIVDKRTVTGTRLTYSPADDKYVVVGAPVKMVDAECQETSGKTLTFWKASDRVLVDGNNEVRTQTKGGGKCTGDARPSDGLDSPHTRTHQVLQWPHRRSRRQPRSEFRRGRRPARARTAPARPRRSTWRSG